MLDKRDFFKIMVVAQDMDKDMHSLNDKSWLLLKEAESNLKSKSISTADKQTKAVKKLQDKRDSLEKRFNILYEMLQEFTDSNVNDDFVFGRLNQKQLEFLELS